jgi:hypothetical protein
MLSPPVPDVIPPKWLDLMGTAWSLGPHPAGVKLQARQVLQQIAPFSEEAGEGMIRMWIAPVIASVSNPRPKEEAAAWFSALLLALDGMPIGAFTEATQRDLLRRCTHWPAAAEVYAVVSPTAARIAESIAGLQRMIIAPTKTEGEQL